jgi:hypothetical protein
VSLFVTWRVLTVAVVLAILACGPAPQQAAKNVKVTLVVILASDRDNQIDPKLEQIASEVRKRKPELTSFRIASCTCESLPVNKPTTFPIPANETVQITIIHGADTQDRVKLAVQPPCQREIVYRTVCGKFLPLVTRCETKQKERLILAIRVQPCLGK